MKKIILAGVLVAFPSMNPPTRLGSYLAASRWANQAIEAALLDGRMIDQDLLADAAYQRPLWNLYPDGARLRGSGCPGCETASVSREGRRWRDLFVRAWRSGSA